MGSIKQDEIIKLSPLLWSLHSAIFASLFLFGCGGGDSSDNDNVPVIPDSEISDNANVPVNPDSEIKHFTSLSCVSPDNYESDDKFVMLDAPGILEDLLSENDNVEFTLDYFHMNMLFLKGSIDASGLGVPLLYCNYERAQDNNCSDNVDMGGDVLMGTKGSGSINGDWLSFEVYNISKETLIESHIYTFKGEAPYFWNGNIKEYSSDGSIKTTVEWSRNDAGDEHYSSKESDGGYLEFFEKADCSGSISVLLPDTESLEMKWSVIKRDALSAEYTLCYLDKDPVECVSDDFSVSK